MSAKDTDDKPVNSGRKSSANSWVVLIGTAVAAGVLIGWIVSVPVKHHRDNQKKTATIITTADKYMNSNLKAASPRLYFSPASKDLSVGDEFSVEVRADSGKTDINAVQANFSYPADKLELVNVDANASPFTTEAQNIAGDGKVTLARGIIGKLSGDQLVATINFKAKAGGTASLAFSKSSLESADKNQNIIGSLAADGTASFKIK